MEVVDTAESVPLLGRYEEATAAKAIDTMEGTFGVHHGQRRNHTKGIGALGTFVGNPGAAKEFSRSRMFEGDSIEVVARFSLAGADPEAADAERSARGLGLQFRLSDGSLQHITMLHTPMFFAQMPKTFIDKFTAVRPDPRTGTPKPAVVKAFLDSHPDNTAQFKFLTDINPPVSYGSCAYFGIHTFKFVNRAGKATLVRWRFQPRDGEKNLTDAQLASMPRDFLNRALMERMQRGPVRWDMIVSIGEPGDSELDPTVLWPTTRREVNVGTLSLKSAIAQEHAASYKINFDPLVMADGIEPTDDPILLFRSPSYGLSYARRLRNL
ncbi:MAG: catalase family peroxidase [Variovorax sp.]|nr:MAG: catalase family peroxidase [Variovorax sp.]